MLYISDYFHDVYALVASPPIQLLAQGPTSTERAGDSNPTELGYCRACAGDPIDTYSGDFTHTFSDLSVAGRGLPLAFSQTYNAGAAAVGGRLGFGWTDSYDMGLAVDGSGNATITQENGSTVTFAPNGSGGFTPPSRVLATLVKNGDGSYTFTRLQDQTTFTFNAGGQLISETDRNGYTTNLTYAGGNLASVTDQAGRTLTFAEDGSGRITSVSDPLGRSVSFTYDGSGNLQTATDVNGGVWHFTYDASHRMLTMSDPRGGVTTNVYDSSNRVTSQSDPMSRATIFAYTAPDSNGDSSTTITDPKGNVTVEQYYNGLLLSRTLGSGTPQAATWSYTYDPLSLGLVSTTDPNGNITSQTWDASGNLLATTDPLGRTITSTYNSFNEVTSITDPNGVTTTKTYDARGNLTSVATPLVGTSQARTTSYTYGDSGHPGDVTAMTDPNGKTWSYAYDANGDQTSQTDPLGDKTTSTYNAIGWKLTQVSPNGNVAGGNPAANATSYQYDHFGDVTLVTTPLGETTASVYDADRNLTGQTDADGHVTQNTYDADNELTKTLRADGSTLTYGYDADGNQTSQTDGLGRATRYTYDPLNRLVTLSDPLSRQTSYTYDGAGNRLTLKDAAGQITSYSYDADNEQVGISYSDGHTPNVSYTYDTLGQRLTMTDGSGTTSYAYDSLHRLTAMTNGAGTSFAYGYALNGELTAIVYPGGKFVTRTYDAAGRVTKITDWLGHASSFSYDADGNLTREVYPNHITGTMTYDHDDRLSSIVDLDIPPGPSGRPYPTDAIVVLRLGYTRDALGQLTALGGSGDQTPGHQHSEAYGYTALNQVSALNSTGYAYDHADNLTKAGNATLTYNAANELTGLAGNGGSTSYTYDQRGNRTKATTGSATVTYGYDQANRLTSYTAGATSAQYAYNGDGLRTSKTVGGVTEQFAWDVAEGLPLLVQDGTTYYVNGPDGLPLEQIAASGKVSYYLHDAEGSTRVLTDAGGVAVGAYSYDAYGNVTAYSGNTTSSFQYAGQYRDAESGLLYLRARYYDPATGQFLSRDPLVPLTKEPYGYAGSDPLNMGDPSGKWAWFDQHAAQISFWAGKVSDVASIVGTACDIGALFSAGNPALIACGLAAGGVATLADYAKTQADVVAHPKDVTQDEFTNVLDVGLLIGGVSGAADVAKLWQKGILFGYEGLTAGMSLYDLTSGWSGTASEPTSQTCTPLAY